jgi:two-component system NtrC family response regulator
MKHRLLIVDDDEEIRSQMRWGLTEDYEISLAEDRASALNEFRANRPHVVLLDLGLPPHAGDPQEGMATLAEILQNDSGAKVIIATGQSDKAIALRAVAEGAYDFLAKPIDITELKVILKRAFYLANLERENREMQDRLNAGSFQGMLGTSPQMQDVFSSMRKVGNTDVPVLILGESGTGKEMVASGIHKISPRKDGPFVAINCGAIPETLLESELFGHEKGAFTGAHAQRLGRIESAEGGTLFLDEIGELPLPLQVKLLRFLQEKTIQRVGGRKEIPVNARVVAATNVDLKKAMAEGRFREDLYYRIAVVTVKLPPLRERQNDIPLLAQAFLKKFAGESGKESRKFAQQAIRAMELHSWPGNVRELENRVRRAAIMAEGSRVTEADLELSAANRSGGRTLKEAREEVEKELVTHALQKHHGNVSQAANDLGISRPTLYELMEKFGFKKAEPASSAPPAANAAGM